MGWETRAHQFRQYVIFTCVACVFYVRTVDGRNYRSLFVIYSTEEEEEVLSSRSVVWEDLVQWAELRQNLTITYQNRK